ncbi:hypothetical protein LAZ67_12002605 [Cordylochernes scorpioides]|uniref:Uncharacterized protein n=1 Tax=Cordylochernes scorpioides TaxID=51811 RepID=A0ABY6L4C9_9ARAC|nr:hypothetical protein LAZ67_12002605 [Cordylochernes scorpioides]
MFHLHRQFRLVAPYSISRSRNVERERWIKVKIREDRVKVKEDVEDKVKEDIEDKVKEDKVKRDKVKEDIEDKVKEDIEDKVKEDKVNEDNVKEYKLLRCKDTFLIASDCLIEQLIKADREDEEIEDVDIVQANLFGRSEGVLQKMEQLLAKPTVDRESIVSGGNEGKSNLHRLPKLELPKFGGEAREWLQFWSAFQSVHDDDSISACVKFQYLQNCMKEGSVSEEIVSFFPNSAANYPLAISTLKERFGREDMLVEVYVRDLIAIILENAYGRNTTSFSTVYVRLSSQLRALGSLGVTTDKCAAILYPMVESALPEDLFVAWERTRHYHKPDEDGKHKSSEVLLEKLMEFLKHEVEGWERMRLARQPFSISKGSQKSDGFEEKSKNLDASVDMSNRVRCQDVLLQTSMVKINGENKSKVVRAMLDSGSQNSYVLEQTASEVGLTMLGKKEVVHLLFGGVKSRPQQHKRYRIYISDVDSKYNCNFEVQDCSTICSAMPSAQPTEWMTELRSKGIDLDVYWSNTEIELLLGADVYAKLLTGKKIELESGPVALETKLGWTVSGKVLENVQTTKSQSVLSCLVRDATIQDLWRLDVIGIMEPMKEKSKEELSVAALEHFNQTVKQNEDCRYSINLPWIGEHPPLPNYKLISEKKLESTTALAGIKRDMNWSVFVAGRVKKIRQNSSITDWRHVPGKENPADIPSRGASILQLITTRWWEGPVWLKNNFGHSLIPKLDGNNYYSWAIRTKSILIQKDIWDAIEPGFPSEASEKQKRKDSLALSVILLAVEDSFLDDIGDCKRAIDAWQILEDIHTKYGLLHILQLLREFFNIVKRNDEDMKEYFARIMECHRKLAKCHHGFGDGELALIMLLGLPKSYEPLILSLEQQEEKLSTSVVKSKLLLEEKRQKQRQIPQEDPNCAFAVRRKEDTCKSPCQERNKFEYDQPRNYHNTWTEGKRENYNYSRQIRCFSCGRLGHIARNCRFANSSRRISEGMLKQSTLDLTHKVLFANNFKNNNSQNIWFLDSGATEHMTSNRLKLTNTKSISTSVEMANNEKIKVSEMGDVTIKLGHEYGVEELKKEDEGEYQNEAAIPRGYSGTDGETISVEKDLNNLERREDGEQAYEDEALRREDEGQNETIILRRSSRIAARQKEYCRSAFHRGIVEHKSHQDEMPSSYEEALNMPKAQNRLRSIECEMVSLREHRQCQLKGALVSQMDSLSDQLGIKTTLSHMENTNELSDLSHLDPSQQMKHLSVNTSSTSSESRTRNLATSVAEMVNQSNAKLLTCITPDSSSILFNAYKNTVEKHFTSFICNFRTINKKCSIIHQRKHAGETLKFCPPCEYSTKCTSNSKRPIKIHTDEKLHQCPHCDHRTMLLGSLKRHIRTHTSERPHLCPHCDYRTNHPSDLKCHIRTHTDEKPYLCPHCMYRGKSSTTLRTHIRTHTGEKPHLCPHCDYRAISSSTLRTHIRTHTGEKPHLCPHCDYRAISSSTLRTHIRTHTGEKPHLCPHCDYRTNRPSDLKCHIRIHTGEKPYLCPHCDYRAITPSTLRYHVRTHTGEKPHLCPHCEFRTNRPSDLKKHIRTHTGEKPYLCPHCDYRAMISSTLRRHIRTHTGEKPHLCPHCYFRTNRPSDLEKHIRTHTGEKPHLCPHCDYRAISSSALRRHIKIHTGEKPHLCPHCYFRTNRPSDLKKHIRTHTGEKPYLCPHCDYRAMISSTLRRHIRTHTGEKPHLCPHCDFRTIYLESLKTHIRTHTGEKPYLCPHCDYRTNHTGDLKKHIITHTGEKPHLCPHCDYRAISSCTLGKHIRTHIVECPQLPSM